jgi:hypothetical protein
MTRPTLTIKGRFQKCLNQFNRKNLTLTVRGLTVCCANNNTTTIEQKFDWENALIDAIITSGITFFSALGGTALIGDVNTVHIIESATVAALSQFFIFLALKRGLVKPQVPLP